MADLDGVLFDVDDTLVDTRAAFARSLRAIQERYLPGASLEQMLHQWRSDPGGWYRRYTRGEVDHLTQRRHRAAYLHETFGGEPVTEESFAAWDELFWGTFERSWTAFDDAAPALAAARAAGLRVGVVTNAAVELQERKLAAVGLTDLPVLVGVDTLGFGKPDARVFAEGARLLGTDPARTAYVGDEPEVDAVGARDAGLRGVWLARPGVRKRSHETQGDEELRLSGIAVIGTLAELPQALGTGPGDPAARPAARSATGA
ncbi:HAD family hydrolase [Myceligenerans crystallogenes]|uniref:HAD family hydrolase n=1 Tax=Myceligenerans crystallogenes TaxID=316335 RepID=A0ABP4ZZL9_9MICO